MKTSLITLLALVALTLGAAFAQPGGGEAAWLDLENCAMCKNLAADMELFDAMTWDTKLFKNGLVEITTVPAKYEERFNKLMATMEATGARLMAGEQLALCGMCRSYGALMQAGVDNEQLKSGDVYLSVISSRDPAVIEKIHKHGQKTIEEFAKWMAAQEDAEDDHTGHHH